MGLFDPNIETRQPESQATPLANDMLQMIRNQITGGTFGEGFGPLQREAGTALRQFLNSGGAGVSANLPDFTTNFNIRAPQFDDFSISEAFSPNRGDLTELVSSLEAVQNRRVDEQAADLREAFGAAGSRFGTSLARGEGDFRRDAQADFQAQIGQLLEGARRFDTQAGLQAAQQGIGRDLAIQNILTGRGQMDLQALIQNAILRQGGERLGLQGTGLDLSAQQSSIQNLLQGLGLMQEFGTQNIAPAFGLAQLGILPEDTIVTDSLAAQIAALFSGGGDLVRAVAGAGAGGGGG